MLEEFKEKQQLAMSWMQDVQRQLKVNDCTEGPLDVLEARLQETKVGEGQSPDGMKQNENTAGRNCRGRQCAGFQAVHQVPLLLFIHTSEPPLMSVTK